MLPTLHSSAVRRIRTRPQRSTTKQHQSNKSNHRTRGNSSSSKRWHDLLTDLKRSASRFFSYTITELEPICQQIAIQQMAATTTTTTVPVSCPLICIFCQDFIYEPVTFYCGHTFCNQCIHNEELSSSTDCPRCPSELQGQVQSPIVRARERPYRKNCFLEQVFEHSEGLKTKCETLLLCHKGQMEYSKGNYQQAIDIYSQIIDQYENDHLALYHRAKAYAALKQFPEGLRNATQVITLKPQWSKGYLCQSEILFEMKHFTAALQSSLKALVMDPDDQIGKQITARHLHAVLHNDDDKEAVAKIEAELEKFNETSLRNDDTMEMMTSAPNEAPLTMCKLTQRTNACFCLQLDYKKFQARDFECSICVTLLWLPVTTPCGHVFCRECLIRSVDNTQAQCPICKSSLDEFFPMLLQSHVNKTEIISKLIETYLPTEYLERQQLYEQENIGDAAIARSVVNDTQSVTFEIPIFVCVLTLPCCACPLHVYEPRYRLMMRRTVETESRTFGMCSYDEQTDTFADYGTLLYIRGLMYTADGRSVVDTMGQRRFRVIERGMKDGYCTARVELIRDHEIEQHEFDDLFQLNRDTYNRVHQWFDHLNPYVKSLITRQLQEYPPCDDLIQGSADGPSWAWIMLNCLPIESLLKYTALAAQSLRIRLQMINDTIDFQSNHHQQETTTSSNDEQ